MPDTLRTVGFSRTVWNMPHDRTRQLQANGPCIRALREQSGQKRRQFAATVFVSYDHLAAIENGHHDASIELLNRIAKQLRVPLAEVLNTRGEVQHAQTGTEAA